MKSILIVSSSILISLNSLGFNFKSEIDDTLYSEKVESFLTNIQSKYGENFNDSIWNEINDFKKSLIGIKLDDFSFTDVYGNVISINDIPTPIMIQVSASWCGPCVAMTPIVNKLSKKYKNKVKLIIITHDTKERAFQYSKKYNKDIPVIPATEKNNPMNAVKLIVNDFQHLLPFPTTYFIDENKRIVHIQNGGVMPGSFPDGNGGNITITQKEANADNYKLLLIGLEKIIY